MNSIDISMSEQRSTKRIISTSDSDPRDEFTQRIVQDRSQKQLRWLITTVAVVCGCLLLITLFSMVTSSSSGYSKDLDLYNKALVFKKQGDWEGALSRLKQISSRSSVYPKAKELIDEIEKLQSSQGSKSSREEEVAFEDFKIFAYNNAQNPEKVREFADGFRRQFPESRHLFELERIVKDLQTYKETSGEAEYSKALALIKTYLAQGNFGKALEEINQLYEHYRDSKYRKSILEKHREVASGGAKYYADRVQEALQLKKEKKYMAARSIYYDVVYKLGNGSVLEFQTFCTAASREIEALSQFIER